MPSQPQPLDIVAVAIAFASLLFEPRLAEIIGPYAVIILGAILGGALSASRRGPTTRAATIVYMALMIILALLVTVPLAEVTAAYIPIVRVEPRVLFAPLAAVVAAIGNDWVAVGKWVIGLVRRAVERWAGAPPNPPPSGGPTP